ncbi:MAG TPA: hypothetical protein VHZ54_07130, partial [Solirubrobacterales bacterium]|nr:hypothetical protein [Solirubrobacterales bacterium]
RLVAATACQGRHETPGTHLGRPRGPEERPPQPPGPRTPRPSAPVPPRRPPPPTPPGEGQEEIWIRRLFSPGFVVWLAESAPWKLSFELVDGASVAYLRGHHGRGRLPR